MNALARSILAALALIVVMHYQDGGTERVRRWANYVFTGRA